MNLTTTIKVRDVDWEALKKWYERDNYNVFYREGGGLRVILRGKKRVFFSPALPGWQMGGKMPFTPSPMSIEWQEMHFITQGDDSVLLNIIFNFWVTMLYVFCFLALFVIVVTGIVFSVYLRAIPLPEHLTMIFCGILIFPLFALVVRSPHYFFTYFFVFRGQAMKKLKELGQPY